MPINDLVNSKVQSELIRQNWESARYHESSRWKYTYYYYAAFGAYIIYFVQAIRSNHFGINKFEPFELFVHAFIYFILFLIGHASFYHLIYSNMEYKNHIRAIEYIARDLGFNQKIAEYRKGDKNITRNAYMALPLMLGIRKKMPFTVLTGAATSVSAGVASFLILIFFVKVWFKESCVESYHFIISVSFISLIIFIFMLWKMISNWHKIETEAERELDQRDPMGKGANKANAADAKNGAAD